MLFFLLIFTSVFGQEFQLKITSKKELNKTIINHLSFNNKHASEESIYNEIDSIINKLEIKGYLNTVLDSVFKTETSYTAIYNVGKQTKKIKINYTGLLNDVLSKKILQQVSSKVTDTYFEIPFNEIEYTMQFIVDYYENAGYSFTQSHLTNIKLKDDYAIAELKITTTKTRTIDKIIVKGYIDFPKKFINHELHLKIGSKFNKTKLKNASIAMHKITFAEEQKSPEVLFTNDSTFIYLYLKKKQANKFDGVIGFSSKEEKSGLEFNGYIDLSFNNIFNNGENIDLFWKNNGNESQRFYIGAKIPYIFNLPIIPKINFELFRQDSTYSNTLTNIDLSYSLNKRGYISASFHTENSNSLSKEPSANVESFTNVFYGINYSYETIINDNLFPVKFKLNVSSYLGNRNSENTKTNQSKFSLKTNYQWRIDQKNYIFLQNQSALLNSKNYFENELYRIGGVDNIRGVNEESIFASSYSIFNLEYRFRPNHSSYFYTISDFAYIEDKSISKNSQIYSLGIGYAFFTKLGLLNISYAIGKFKNNPFIFNDSKLHIKVISYF